MAEQTEHWMLRAAGFLGMCTGRALTVFYRIAPTRLMREAFGFLAAGWIVRAAGFDIAAIVFFALSAALFIADVLIDELVDRMKDDG